MTTLNLELKKYSKDIGVDFLEAADLDIAREFVYRQGGEHIAGYPRGISIGIRLVDSVVDELYRHEEPSVLYSYRGVYNAVNTSLDQASLKIAKKIEDAGYNAYPIPSSQTINTRRLEGAISHKLVANLAGHGWIGKSCLLITPKHGPRLRLATILTDAPLETGSSIPNQCGDCRECVDACPPKAFTGKAFKSSEPRDVRFRAHLCRDYTQRRSQLLGEGICGLCVYSCPYGKTNS